MVNNANLRILPEDQCQVEVQANGRRKIVNGPVYSLPETQNEARRRDIKYVTNKALDDKMKVSSGMRPAQVKQFIGKLRFEDHYKDSERCDTSIEAVHPDSPYELDCDAYAMKWNAIHGFEHSSARKRYLKLGFRDDKPQLLVVSMHD